MLTIPNDRAYHVRVLYLALLSSILLLSLIYFTPAYADGGGCGIQKTVTKTLACPAGQTGAITATCSGSSRCTFSSMCADKYAPSSKNWRITSNTCVNAVAFAYHSYETSTNSCPSTHPSGVINTRRDFEVWSDGSKRNYSAWYETSRTCAAVKSSTQAETQTLSCPSTQPSGTWTQRRTYDLWTDGTKKNYSAWSDVTKTCAAVKSSTQTETQTLSCPSTQPSGTWTQRRTYDLWTDGTKKNYSAWSDVTKTCAAVKSSTQTETQTLTCPSTEPSGTWTQSRTYDLWTDGTKKNFSAWSDVTKTCAAVKSSTQTETQTLTCPSTEPSGTWTQSRTYDLWTDGSKKNYSAWSDATKTCSAVKSSTQTETRTLACPAATPSGTWTQQRSYEVWSDGSKKNYGAWSDVTVCQNEAPVAQNKAVSTNEDASASVVLSATDDHSNLSYEIAQAPSSGSASLSGSTLVYTPPSDWNGSTSLTYRAKDPYGAYSAPARVSITVTPVNDAPVAQDKQIRTNEDVAGSVTLSATDIDSPAPTVFEIVTQPANATAVIQGAVLTVTPKSDWNGTTALTYRAKDSAGAWSAPATVTVNVEAVSDAPVAQAKSLSIDEDGSGKVVLSATDIDSAPSSVFEIVDASANVSAVISGSTLTVTPKADWNGTTTLTYRAQDAGNTSQWSAKAPVTITVKAVNDAPIAQNKTIVTDEDVAGSVILTATDIDSPAPTVFEIVAQPANATAAIQASQLTVTPAADWNGSTSLTYRAKDSAGAWSAPAMVAVTVRPTGDAPIAVSKAMVTKEDTAGTVTLSATDIDSPAASIFEVVSSSAMGRASIVGSTLTFTPSKDWNGTTSLTYRAQDDSGLWSTPASVNITVEPVNDAPVSKALAMTVVEDKSASIRLQATDIDSAQSFVFEIVEAPRHVDYSLAGNELTIMANHDWYGTTGLTYRSRDDDGLWSKPAPVEIEVGPSPLSQVESGDAIMQIKWNIKKMGH